MVGYLEDRIDELERRLVELEALVESWEDGESREIPSIGFAVEIEEDDEDEGEDGSDPVQFGRKKDRSAPTSAVVSGVRCGKPPCC